MLLFKKRFLDAIRRGAKTQTIRVWKHCRMRAGQRSYIPGAGYIRVEAIEQVRICDLTDEDAHLDGFATLTQLHDEIAKIYPDHGGDGMKTFRIRFSLLPPDQQHKRAPRAVTDADDVR